MFFERNSWRNLKKHLVDWGEPERAPTLAGLHCNTCVCATSVCLWIEQRICTFQICTHTKADLSLSNYTLMDLLNATMDHDGQGQAANKRYRQITHS